MTLSEFKAWFEGFTEQMDGPPNKKQWQRICKRMDEIDDLPLTYSAFMNGYEQPSLEDQSNGWHINAVELKAGETPIEHMLHRAGQAEYQST